MNGISRRLAEIAIAIAFLLPGFVAVGRSSRSLNEDAALDLLLRTLQQDHVYDKRISLDCVTFDAEETTRIYFQLALREKHDKKCGGDPDTAPVIDRYRVFRASGKIDRYDVAKDDWQHYKSTARGNR